MRTAIFICLTATTLLAAPLAEAATITVTEAIDDDPFTDNGECSLREAVMAANTNTPRDACAAGEPPPVVDEIRFDPALNGTPIVLSIAGGGENSGFAGDLDIRSSVRIIGNGNVVPDIENPANTTANTLISAGGTPIVAGIDRVFHIHQGIIDPEVVMEQLAITGGFGSMPANGGGIASGFDTSLTLRNVAVYSNRTVSTDLTTGVGDVVVHSGGGIRALGSLTLENSAVYGNIASASGNDKAQGGGISSFAALTIKGSVIFGNEASASASAIGGGIEAGFFATISDSWIGDNLASSEDESIGGGISATTGSTNLPLTIERSLISGNEAFARGLDLAAGGGIHLLSGKMLSSNSTVSENRVILADDGGGAAGLAIGAGLWVQRGTATLNNSTLTANSTEHFVAVDTVSGGLHVSDPTVFPAPPAELRISNTVIADASGDLDCRGGSIISEGYNLLGNKGNSALACDVTAGPEDQIGDSNSPIDPGLSSLDPGKGNGRSIQVGEVSFPMQFHFLAGGGGMVVTVSPAIDAGNPDRVAKNSPPLCETVDQRGFLRPAAGGTGVGERCDIGAVERNAQPPMPTEGDGDGDGISDEDEEFFGLDPDDPTGDNGANGDPDGDGLTNADEVNGDPPSHPRGFFTQLLAEGATGDFFQTDIGILNAGRDEPGHVLTTLFPETAGAAVSLRRTLDPLHRWSVDANAQFPAGTGVSTRVESDQPVVAMRQMTWDASVYGSSLERAVPEASTTWFFAEGSTSLFALFHLIENPNREDAQVTITYLRSAAQGPPVVQELVVPASTRRTVLANTVPGLERAEVSAVITSDLPIVAERAMFFGIGGPPFAAGQVAAGVPALATRWSFAEGATVFFDTFLLLGNPGQTDAQVTVTYQFQNGATLQKQHTVFGESRKTIFVDAEDPLLRETVVAMTVDSTQPIAAERAMWWGPSSASWYETHASFGTTEAGTVWAAGEGRTGGPHAEETFVLLSNATSAPANVRVTLIYDDGLTEEQTVVVASDSRNTRLIRADFPNSEGRRYSILVESLAEGSGAASPITVEISRYQSTGTRFGNAGGNALATRIR